MHTVNKCDRYGRKKTELLNIPVALLNNVAHRNAADASRAVKVASSGSCIQKKKKLSYRQQSPLSSFSLWRFELARVKLNKASIRRPDGRLSEQQVLLTD